MGFDADAFFGAAPAAPAGGGFDADAFFGAPAPRRNPSLADLTRQIDRPGVYLRPSAPAEPLTLVREMPNAGSALDAASGGFVRGATFGITDKIAGLAYGKGMQEAMREREDVTAEAHPYATVAGEILGGVATSGAYGLVSGARATAAMATARGGSKAAVKETAKATGRYEAAQGAQSAAKLEGAGARALAREMGAESSVAGAKAARDAAAFKNAAPWWKSDAAAKRVGKLTNAMDASAPAAAKAKDAATLARGLMKNASAAEKAAAAEIAASRVAAFKPLVTAKGIADAGRAARLPSLLAVRAGAAQGALYGAGTSRGETIDEVAGDAILGAGIGGAAAKALPAVGRGAKKVVGKVVGGAQDRIDKRMIQDLVGSTNASARNRLLISPKGQLKTKDVAAVMKSEPSIVRAADETARHEAVEQALERHGRDILDPIYQGVDNLAPAGMGTADIGKVKDAFVTDLRKRFRVEAADAIEKAYDARIAGRNNLTASEMRDFVGSLQSTAFQGTAMNPTPAREAAQDFSMKMRGFLNDHIESVTQSHGGGAANVRAANNKMSILQNIKDVTLQSAKREAGATMIAPFSMKNLQMVAKGPQAAIGALGASLATGNPLPLAGYAALRAVDPTARLADKAMAKLAIWARGAGKNAPRAEWIEKATELGIAREMIDSSGPREFVERMAGRR